MFADICGVEAAFWRRMESNVFPWKKHRFLPEETLFYMKRSGGFVAFFRTCGFRRWIVFTRICVCTWWIYLIFGT